MENSNLTQITYPAVKQQLEAAQNALRDGKNADSLAHSARAFAELTDAYTSTKRMYGQSPFFFGKDMTFLSSFHMGVSDRKMADFVDAVKGSVTSMQNAMKIISLGLDYRKYVKFQALTPHVTRTMGGIVLQGKQGINSSTENCQYCIDFVVDAALELQGAEFSSDDLFEARQQ